MKSKKLIALILLAILIIAEFSFINFSNFVSAQTGNVEDLFDMNTGKFHYDQLNTLAKRVYDGISEMYSKGILKTGTESFDIAENDKYVTQAQLEDYMKGNAELKTAMNAARYAFYADYPEVFYVNFQKLNLRVTKDAEGVYHANLGSGNLKNYYVDGFSSKEQVESAIVAFNDRVDEIATETNALVAEAGENLTIKKIKYVHNEIIKNTKYSLESDCLESEAGFIGTPYGALITQKSVCEGYARALKTVLDKVGINSILVQGVHQYEGSAAVPHMWNYVQIEKETETRAIEKVWYAIDATLDDPIVRIHPEIFDKAQKEEKEPGWDIVDGFENTRYCLVGAETMNKEHTPLETVEAAGNYVFKYPEIQVEDYGIDTIINDKGLLIKYKQEGTQTEDYQAGDFYISYNGKGYAEAKKDGRYILMKYHEYRPGDEIWIEGNWGYMDPTQYVPGGFLDYDDHLYISVPNSEYVEFAVTTLAPSGNSLEVLTYQGDESDFVAQTGKIYNPSGIYKAKPYIKKQIPPPTQNVTVGSTYKAEITYDDTLVLEEGAQAGYKLVIRRLTGEIVTPEGSDIITNFRFDGTNKITFDFKPSKMYADDNASYTIYITGLVGKNSGKAPLEIYYGADNPIACAFSMNKAKSWNVFAKPMLMEDEDLSMNGWTTKDGESVSDKLSSRIALVTTRTTPEKTNAMLDLMGEQPKDPENVNAGTQNVIASETYDISLNVCRKYVVKTGHKLKLSVGFPAGYGPEDAGVTFKAYHFITDAATGEVTGVEEIPCIVTEYGLIIMCDSFSPFAVAVVEDDGTVEPKEKSVVLTATDGGKVKSVTTSEARALDNQGTSETMITLRKDETKVINIKADEGYELEKLTICGTEQDVSEFENKENINTTISYDDVQGTNCIVDATFVAKSVVQEEADKGETVVIQTVQEPEVTLPERRTLSVGETLSIISDVKAEGMVTYEWYKDGVKLEGKTEKDLTIENTTEADFGVYTLKVKAIVGTASAEKLSNSCIVAVGAFNTSITPGATTDISNLEPGDEFILNIGVSNIGANGIVAMSGKLDFDTNALEIVKNGNSYEISGQNGWNTSEDAFNPNNFKFVTENGTKITEAGTVFTIKFRVKTNLAQDIETIVTLKDATASGGEGVLAAKDASLNLSITVPEADITTTKYTKDDANKEISRIAPGTTVTTFKNNVTTNKELTFINSAGNTLGENDVITTGSKVKVGGDALEYTLIVTGDIDGDGVITGNDLAKSKLHQINITPLTGIYKKAADVDGDGYITINDIAQIKLVLIKQFEIK